MAFDKDSAEQPLVQPQKKTTQVNMGMVVAIAIFFTIVGIVLWNVSRHPEETRNDVHQDIRQSK